MLNAALSMETANFPEAVLRTVTQPFVNLATSISSWVDDTLDKLVNADKYKRENEALHRQLTEMYAQIMDKDALIQENERLREIAGILEENPDFTLSPPCPRIARDGMDVSGNFTIGRGSNSGIKKGDPVMTEVGLVGVVSEIAPTYSRVSTILALEVSVGVVTASGVVGIIENDILYSSNRQSLMKYIDIDSEINVGDFVITSGGNLYPRGIAVGSVVDVFLSDSGLSQSAVIEPAVDIFSVTDVFVITSFDGQGVTP